MQWVSTHHEGFGSFNVGLGSCGVWGVCELFYQEIHLRKREVRTMSLMSEGPTNYPKYYRECYGNPIQLSVVIAESHIELNNDIMRVYAERQISDNRQIR